MSAEGLVEFTKLKERICEAAANALEAANPAYVQAVRRSLEETPGDLERVIAETRPLLGEGSPDWSKLLTAVLDFELVMDKVNRSLVYLSSGGQGTPEARGAWTIYHFDHWIFQMDALFERLDKLVAKVFRVMIRPADPRNWQEKEKAVRNDVAKLKAVVAKVRDPLAHGGGGGVNRPSGRTALGAGSGSLRLRRSRVRSRDSKTLPACQPV